MYASSMCLRLANFYWSPQHPSTYLIKDSEGKEFGIGLIAHLNYAAFNVAWGTCCGQWRTVQQQISLVTQFEHARKFLNVPLHPTPQKEKVNLEDLLTLFSPEGVLQMLENEGELTPTIALILRGAANGAIQARKFQ